MFDLDKDNLEDVIDSNIDNRLPGRNNHLCSSKLSISALQPGKAVLLLSGLLGNSNKATSSKENNSRPLSSGNSSRRLLPSIVLQDLLSPLLKSDDRRLLKTKQSVKLVSGDLADLCDSMGQSVVFCFKALLLLERIMLRV